MPDRRRQDQVCRQEEEHLGLYRNSHLGPTFCERILRLNADGIRFRSQRAVETPWKSTTVKISTIFLRDGWILPSQFILRLKPFSKGWAEALGTLATQLDAEIRGVGWHFTWLADSYSSRALGRTEETAIHQALARTLLAVRKRFNAAELDSVRVTDVTRG